MKSQKRNNEQHGDRNSEIQNQSASVGRKEPVDQWWGRITAVQRMAAQHIALMIEEMTETKRIEIRRGGRWIKVRFVHILDRPEKGCVPAIIVAEPGSKGWN